MTARKPAFSLIEIVVTIAIVAVLLGVLLPSLAGFRGRARAAASQAVARGIVAVHAAYLADHDDTFFYRGPADENGYIRNLDGDVNNYFSASSFWWFMSEGYRPPAEAMRSPFRAGDEFGIDYRMPCVFFASPDYWRPETRLFPPQQWVPTRLFQVVQPGDKSLTHDAFRLTQARAAATPQRDALIAGFVDGSADALAGMPPGYRTADGDFPGFAHLYDAADGMHTLGGVAGTDR